MTNPVSDNDGITYERAAILEWLSRGNSTSPVTRRPLTATDLRPNLALRALIEEAGTTTTNSSNAAAVDPQPAPHPEPIQVAISRVRDHPHTYHVQLSTPAVTPLPTEVIKVLDNSGSMSLSSVDTTRNKSDAAMFSRSNLVEHSTATAIELTDAPHRLGVIVFNNNAHVALEPITMDRAGKMIAKTVLPEICPGGGTNIWAGLQKALKSAEQSPSTNIAIIIQTDGESDPALNPPRGIPDTFRTWIDTHPDVARRVTVHTIGYGFGRSLDMPLLRQIAAIGKGTVSYIPDGSMVGTVFIHLMANLLSCVYRGVRIQVPEEAITIPVGFLQAGQTRDFIVRTTEPHFTVAVSADGADTTSVSVDITDSSLVETTSAFALAHELFMTGVTAALNTAESTGTADISSTYDAIKTLESHDSRITALLDDLQHTDPAKGQIGKALATRDNFDRWGRHYIPAYLSGQQNQWPVNFRDAGSAIYGTPATRALIALGDEKFLSIPPPTPSNAGGPSYTTLTMSSTHSAAGPCFLGASLMTMADGSKKPCEQVGHGDITDAGYIVRCVIKTLVPYADIVRLNDRPGGFTLWHPVFINNEWVHPASIGTVTRIQTDAIYNFVLDWPDRTEDRPGVIFINDIMTCTMGHNMTGPVIGHPYFGRREPGKRNVIDDLIHQPGWSTGYIIWKNLHVDHDAVTGMINSMTPIVQ